MSRDADKRTDLLSLEGAVWRPWSSRDQAFKGFWRKNTAEDCAHCRYAQTTGHDLQYREALPAVRYSSCFFAAALLRLGARYCRGRLDGNEPHGIWFVHQRSLMPRPRVHGLRSRAQRCNENKGGELVRASVCLRRRTDFGGVSCSTK
jgi:hypothetical protein